MTTHLGHFPFCPGKVDVSGFDYWTTLGGTQKGNTPTDQEIALSLINATKLYWLFFRISAYNDFDSDGAFNDFIDAEGHYTDREGWKFIFGQPEPIKRVCKTEDGFGGLGNSVSMTRVTNNSIALAFQMQTTSGNVMRLYDGDTTNESNFVGYGLKSNPFAARDTTNIIGLNIYSGSSGCAVQLNSYGDTPTIGAGEISDEAYVIFNGIHFVCCAWSRNTKSGVSGTANAANLEASWTRNASEFYETRLSSIQFYD